MLFTGLSPSLGPKRYWPALLTIAGTRLPGKGRDPAVGHVVVGETTPAPFFTALPASPMASAFRFIAELDAITEFKVAST